MINKQNEVGARLKDKVNYSLTFVHCVARKTNLTVIDARKFGPCKNMSREINALLNSVTVHFKTLYKKKTVLLQLQKELTDSTKCLKRYQ